MQRDNQIWSRFGGALLLLGGVGLLPLVNGPNAGALQVAAPSGATQPEPTRSAEASKAQGSESRPTQSAQPRVIVQPADSIPGPNAAADVIFRSSPPQVVDAMLELAQVQPGEVVFDLGSGDGRVCIAAARKYGARAFGYEIRADLVKESLENVKKNKVEHLVTIERRDIFKVDLSGADVVTLWLLPTLNLRLIPQLEKMRPGSRVVSQDYDMHDVFKPDKVIEVEAKPESWLDAIGRFDSGNRRNLYLWKAPFQKDDGRYREFLRRHRELLRR